MCICPPRAHTDVAAQETLLFRYSASGRTTVLLLVAKHHLDPLEFRRHHNVNDLDTLRGQRATPPQPCSPSHMQTVPRPVSCCGSR